MARMAGQAGREAEPGPPGRAAVATVARMAEQAGREAEPEPPEPAAVEAEEPRAFRWNNLPPEPSALRTTER